ncbi:hypothetical protein LCGC14_2828310, partial [marine sediment metagenome]
STRVKHINKYNLNSIRSQAILKISCYFHKNKH